MPAPVESAPRIEGRTHALQYAFTAFLRDPDNAPAPAGVEQRRLDIYVELLFNNIEGLLAANFPVIRRLYGDDWYGLVRDFFAQHQSRTPLFLEIGREFLRYLEERQQQDRNDPPFLLELAHYEWAELALSIDEADVANIAHDPAGDPVHGIPVVSPLAWSLGYRFPVQLIAPNFLPEIAPEQPTLLLLVRDRSDAVSFIEINPLTALLLQKLQENSTHTGLYCLDALLRENGQDGNAAMREGGIAVLHELKAREAILGTL